MSSTFRTDEEQSATLKIDLSLPVTAGAAPPSPPQSIKETDVEREVLENLLLKLAISVTRLTSESAARKLCLPLPIVAELLEELRSEQLLDMLGQAGPFNFRFAITGRGRERARRAMEVSAWAWR